MSELNPQFKIIIIIFIGLIILTGIPFKLAKDIISPKHNEINATPTPIIIYRNVSVFVTPTPDGQNYFAGEYQTGIRLLNHPFSIYKTNISNVQNYKSASNNSLKITINVYDYAKFEQLHVWDLETSNSPNDNTWQLFRPEKDNYEYLIIFVSVKTNEIISINTPDVLLPVTKQFGIQLENTMFYPVSNFPNQEQIEELENRKTLDNTVYIQQFGKYNAYEGITVANKYYNSTTNEYENTFKENSIAGVVTYDKVYTRKGDSNVEDGYIIFEVPKGIDDKLFLVRLNYFAFGSAAWKLDNPYIQQ
jgi:hypothetical protein